MGMGGGGGGYIGRLRGGLEALAQVMEARWAGGCFFRAFRLFRGVRDPNASLPPAVWEDQSAYFNPIRMYP